MFGYTFDTSKNLCRTQEKVTNNMRWRDYQSTSKGKPQDGKEFEHSQYIVKKGLTKIKVHWYSHFGEIFAKQIVRGF